MFDARFLFGLFGIVLALSGVQMVLRKQRDSCSARDPAPAMEKSERLPPSSTVTVGQAAWPIAWLFIRPTTTRPKAPMCPISWSNTGLGLLALMYLAGTLSGLLGIGSGVLKVPAMDLAMHIPMKVSTATSNLLIGLTAAASAVVYFARGDIDPLIAGPVAIGMLLGATQGSKWLGRHPRRSTPGSSL